MLYIMRVTQFQFSVCMYGTCGRIDNKADFDFDFDYECLKMGHDVIVLECTYTLGVNLPLIFSKTVQ